jgi:hypothetical protein
MLTVQKNTARERNIESECLQVGTYTCKENYSRDKLHAAALFISIFTSLRCSIRLAVTSCGR